MSNIPTENDAALWHRYFAIECNNRAWDLVAKTGREKENMEMLNAAHAAAFHWEIGGNVLNNMRAKMLLAEVHALLGYGDSAFAYAKEIREYFLSQETPDWEIAFTHTVYAHAAYVAGEAEEYKSGYQQATQSLENIADPEDRSIVQEMFDQVPPP